MAKIKKQHTKPCSECPWRRKAMAGWLGSDITPDEWIASAHGETLIECHLHAPSQCAGAAIYRSNVFKRPRDPKILLLPSDRETVFASAPEFLNHHNKMGFTSATLKKRKRRTPTSYGN